MKNTEPQVTKKAGTTTDGGSAENKQTNIINVAALSEAELLDKIQAYLMYMNNFANNTRNLHKDIKDTLPKACMLLTQYRKIKNTRQSETEQNSVKPSEKKGGSNVATQTSVTKDSRCEKLKTTEAFTDTPCWWPMFSEVRDKKDNRREAQSSQASIPHSHSHEEDSEDGEEYTMVNRKRSKKQKTVSINTTQKENKASNGSRRQHPIRK